MTETSTSLTEAMAGPGGANGSGVGAGIPLPRRSGARTLLPESWLNRSVRVGFTDCHGGGQEATAVLLDWSGHGPVFALSGERCVLEWSTVKSITLVND